MKWEVRKVENGWGVFLMQEFCKTDESVCYAVSVTKEGAEEGVDRLNNPVHEEKI